MTTLLCNRDTNKLVSLVYLEFYSTVK